MDEAVTWFYIKSATADTVISAPTTSEEPLMRSQVHVCAPRYIDEELWRYDGQHLVNKATELVLDIRKGKCGIGVFSGLILLNKASCLHLGRLRLIEDTDICIYSKKEPNEAHNQLWGVQLDDPNIPTYYICSQSNSGWVLDIRTDHQSGHRKLILSPHQTIDKENQLWVFVPASDEYEEDAQPFSFAGTLVIRASGDIPHHFTTERHRQPSSGSTLSRTLSQTSTSSSSISEDMYPVYGLTPAKRGSQSSVTAGLTLNSFKDCHQIVYLERNPHLSDKTIAMAAAYHVWQTWKEEQASLLTRPSGVIAGGEQEATEITRARLQSMAQDEASRIFDQSDQLNNHKETALSLAKRLIISLCVMTPQSP
ncbi:hypothetical protein BJV82DRAFT_666705 [Fennellomyces sp. T-0311]|nr:hypothetical protein BJV82DRAFT_666705 [Fennellomyces sp. T-0311]